MTDRQRIPDLNALPPVAGDPEQVAEHERGARLVPSRITAIEPQERRRERASVFVDGVFAVGTHASVAEAAGLVVGREISIEELRAVTRSEECRQAKEAALRLLAYRARSRAELRRRLSFRGFEEDVVEETLTALERNGLVDDAEFSRGWVRARTGSRPVGPNRLAAELRGKGVPRETIEEALAPLEGDAEVQMAVAFGRNKAAQLRGEEPRDARRKLGAALARRGFSWDAVRRAVDLLLGEDAAD
jgi:regulatory protein